MHPCNAPISPLPNPGMTILFLSFCLSILLPSCLTLDYSLPYFILNTPSSLFFCLFITLFIHIKVNNILAVMHSGFLNGHQLLCDAHTVPEQHGGTAAFFLFYSLFLSSGTMLLVSSNSKKDSDMLWTISSDSFPFHKQLMEAYVSNKFNLVDLGAINTTLKCFLQLSKFHPDSQRIMLLELNHWISNSLFRCIR